jgi:hypothetical protein
MNKQLIAVVALLVLVLGGVGVWWFTRDEESKEQSQAVTTEQLDKKDTATANESLNSGDPASGTMPAAFTKENVATHATKDDCWTIISGKVYDITEYVPRHPGGDEILMACGKDGTSLFTERKTEEGKKVGSGTPHGSGASSQLERYLMGDLTTESSQPSVDPAAAAAQ